MRRKRIYRAVSVKSADAERLSKVLHDSSELLVGLDVAREVQFAALAHSDGDVVATVKWRHPQETVPFLTLIQELAGSRSISVAMESTGTYGDPLRHLFASHGVDVHQVSAKRVKDATEVYDGVPSTHDAKAAGIIATLHRHGYSVPWAEKDEATRDLTAAVQTLKVFRQEYQRGLNRLEAHLARHWPELLSVLPLTSASLLRLLEHWASPAAVMGAEEKVRDLLMVASHRTFSAERIEEILRAATRSLGVPATHGESAAIRRLASHTNEARLNVADAEKEVRRQAVAVEALKHLREEVGDVTAAVIMTTVGHPNNFGSTGAWVKGFGLNLRTCQSGKKQGQLTITKRGPGLARWYLFMAAGRMLQRDARARVWYERKCKRSACRMKAYVALMRKYCAGLWHVGRGATFDSSLLFDARV